MIKASQAIKKFRRNLLIVFDRYFPPRIGFVLSFISSCLFRHSACAAEEYITQPLLDNFILYEESGGKGFSGIPYSVFKYILGHEEYRRYTHVLSVNDIKDPLIRKYRKISRVLIVKTGSRKYIRYAESCRYFINDSACKPYLIKKEGQVYIYIYQTSEVAGLSESDLISKALSAADCLISPDRATTDLLLHSGRRSFLSEKFRIIETGPAETEKDDMCRKISDLVLKGSKEGTFSKLPEDRRKRVLFYPGVLNPNGVTTSFLSLLDAIDYERYSVAVFLPDRDKNLNFQKKINKNAVVYFQDAYDAFTCKDYMKASDFRRKGAFSRDDIPVEGYRRSIRRVFPDVPFDFVVNYHGYHPGDAAKLCLGVETGRKIIYLHNDLERDMRIKQPQLHSVFSLYKFHDRLFCVSRDSLESNLNGTARYTKIHFNDDISGKMDYVNNMVSPSDLYGKTGKPGDYSFTPPESFRTSFITIGRLSPEKNQLRLVRAFSRVCIKHPDTCLYIAGNGRKSYKRKLEKEIRRLGLGDKVIFTGFMQNPYSLMKRCSCFVLSSDIEGQPITVLEALTLDIPVISTDIAGPHDLLINGEGVLVPVNEEGLEKAMTLFINNGNIMEKKQFNAEVYVKNTIKQFYNKVLNPEENI